MPETRLLLIEDDYDLAEMLMLYFADQDYQVFHADSGEAGIELARSKYPQVILLDVMMPEIDGYETCRRLRQASLTRYIPIIFLTQRDERANKVKGLELGADDYVTKPFDVEELRLRIGSVIRRATQESLHEHRTGLPTATLVEEELERREIASAAYTDLRFMVKGFKAYCEIYGFLAGNEVFAFTARILREAVTTVGTAEDFIGLLGDEFVVFTNPESADKVRDMVMLEFEAGINTYYNFSDVERGGLLLNAGTPDEKLASLMKLVQLQEEL